jgi:hypothetical protein
VKETPSPLLMAVPSLLVEMLDVECESSHRGPVPSRVQGAFRFEIQTPAMTAEPMIEDDRRDLPTLSRPGSIGGRSPSDTGDLHRPESGQAFLAG